MSYEYLKSILTKDEGLRLLPYRDTKGKLTIGVGRNLDDVGISKEESDFLLENDIKKAHDEVSDFPWFSTLSAARQDVIISMCFNMGLSKLREFCNTLSAIAEGDFDKASKEMLSSKWSTEVGDRAKRLAEMMRSGEYVAP